jgi:hypothetical protein
MRERTARYRGCVATPLLALALLAAVSGAAVVAASMGSGTEAGSALPNQEAAITNVTVTGEGSFRQDGTVGIWRSSAANVTVDVSTASDGITVFDACAIVGDNGTATCASGGVNGSGSITIPLPPQEGQPDGRHVLTVTITNTVTGNGAIIDRERIPVLVVARTGDLDQDRLSNVDEQRLRLNMTNPDVDDDGLLDGDEVERYATDPADPDTDDDGALDGVEVAGPSDATDPDTDDDGLLDGTEIDAGLDPTNPDTDSDGLSDSREFNGPTDPADPDTDGDGLDDRAEVTGDTDPTSADTDGDGVDDGDEVEAGLDPTNPDTDGDLLRDGLERTLGTNPTSAVETVAKLLAGLAVIGVIGVWLGTRGLDRDLSEVVLGDGESDPGETQKSTPGKADGGSAATQERDPELLPPDERVESLLRAENGRMRQSDVVEATDWSKAKVSRTLSDMEEAGTVSRFRLGRENVVTLADEESPDELGSSSN